MININSIQSFYKLKNNLVKNKLMCFNRTEIFYKKNLISCFKLLKN